MGASIAFDLTPRRVPRVQTKYRRIVTDIPAPESIPALERLRQFEPRSMSGQPPIVWDRAEGVQVYDRWGNMWLDWSSGVVVTNAGHGHPAIRRAMMERIEHGLVQTTASPRKSGASLRPDWRKWPRKGSKRSFC
jgi:4-aminobutyrate aminotransferase / (S)-3-amino-2-methylpropionate transaminase / 5-aminovalerate transaminase